MDASVHKGMAHRMYQGKTGIIWNITKRAVGVLLKKKVRERYRTKKITVRIEHIRKSGCRKDFVLRCRYNNKYRQLHKKDPKKFPKKSLRRVPKGPEPAYVVNVADTKLIELKIPAHVDVVKL